MGVHPKRTMSEARSKNGAKTDSSPPPQASKSKLPQWMKSKSEDKIILLELDGIESGKIAVEYIIKDYGK